MRRPAGTHRTLPARRRTRPRRTVIAALVALACATTTALGGSPASADDAAAETTESARSTSSPGAFRPLEPCRLLDTRDGGVRTGDHTIVLVPTAGRCDIPEGANALALSITATQTAAPGFATVWPGDQPRPATSTVNYAAGETRANGTITGLAPDGTVAISSSAAAHLVVDVTGAFVATDGATAGRFVPAAPTRLLDTREGVGRLPAGGAITVPLPPGVPSDALALAVTIATSDSVGAGFFTVHPAGTIRPLSSALNTDGRGQVRATGQLVAVSPEGFTVYSQRGEHLIIDMTGWFTGPSAPWSTDGLFVAGTPTRLADTRTSDGERTATPLYPGGTIELDPTVATGGPVAAVAANWTLTRTWRGGFLTVHPARTERPLASMANADRRGQDVAQFGIVPVSGHGVAAFSNAGTHLAVDVTGWFTGTPVAATTDAAAPNTPVADSGRRVLLMGDSTLAGVRWYANSRHALGGASFVLDAESCRRLVGTSCRGREGRRPPNAVDAIAAVPGQLDVVVVMTGYNDWYTTFPQAFEQVVTAARAKGAERIVWLTYRERTTYANPTDGVSQAEGYGIQNRILRERVASGAYDDVTVLDWNAYTADRSGWFTSDGVHFTIAGAYGAADYVSRAVASLHGEPCPAPWTPGGALDTPCPWPDTKPGVVDPITLYAGNPNDVHCYEVGDDRHLECRVDPKLAH